MKKQPIHNINDPEQVDNTYSLYMRDFLPPIVLSLFTAMLMLIPAVFQGVNQEFFFLRDMPLIAFNGLILYSFRINKDYNFRRLLLYALLLLATGLYINLLPFGESDTVIIASLHIPLMLWCFLGLSYVKFDYGNVAGKMDFIRFNGELILMTGLILLAGGLLTGITMALFQVISIDIMPFYMNFIAFPGAAASPIIAWYLIRTYPDITSKIAPVIARIFSPVVVVTLAAFLISLIFSDKHISEDRELLFIFNVMLLGVLALIIFSVSGVNKLKSGSKNLLILFIMSVLAIVINTLALIAIIGRVSDGLTPNRLVVLVTNLLVFINLILIAWQLFRTWQKGTPTEAIEKMVVGYLVVYAIWTVIAVFILPVIFRFR